MSALSEEHKSSQVAPFNHRNHPLNIFVLSPQLQLFRSARDRRYDEELQRPLRRSPDLDQHGPSPDRYLRWQSSSELGGL